MGFVKIKNYFALNMGSYTNSKNKQSKYALTEYV